MQLDQRTFGDVLVVAPRRESLDASVAGPLKQQLRHFVEAGHHKMVLDLDTVRFMDSSGLTVLISTLKTLDHQGGELAVCSMARSLSALFQLTRLDKVFRVFPNAEQAALALQGPA